MGDKEGATFQCTVPYLTYSVLLRTIAKQKVARVGPILRTNGTLKTPERIILQASTLMA